MFHRKIDYSGYSDEDLMRRLVEKSDHEALSHLYHRYGARFLAYFIKIFKGDRQKAQDHLQDLFVRILEKKHQFNPEKKFYTWAFTIAVNLSRLSFREQTTRSIDELQGAQIPVSDLEAMDQKLLRTQLREAIYTLEDYHRVVFILRYTEGFSLKEIAGITETEIGTVKSRLFYATKKMAELLSVHQEIRIENK